jgi:nitroreductase
MTLAINLLKANRKFIITETINWTKLTYPERTVEYNKCHRDMSFIIDALIDDIKTDSNGNITALGNCFWKEHPNRLQIKNPTIEKSIHLKMVDLINSYILTNNQYTSSQTETSQVFLEGEVSQSTKDKIVSLNSRLSTIIDLGPVPGVNKAFNFMSTIMSRRSFRSFKDDPLPTKHVNLILEAACQAPSKNRLYPYQITAITETNEGKLLKQALLKKAFFDAGAKVYHGMCLAPLLLIYSWIPVGEQNMWGAMRNYPESRNDGIVKFDSLTPAQKEKCLHTGIADIHISASWALLMAESLGYETHFVECFRFDIARDLCGINNKYMPKIAVAIGQGKDFASMQNRVPVIEDGMQIGHVNERFQNSQPPKLMPSELTRKI